MDIHVLMGASGAGKTKWAGESWLGATVVSANRYFTGEDGIYRFDKTKMELAHNHCLRQFMTATQVGVDTIIVDNTNTSLWEMAPYISIARACEADVFLHAFVSRPLELCQKESIHDVPPDTIRAQYHRVLNTLEAGLGMAASDIKACRGGVAMAGDENCVRTSRFFRPYQLLVQVH